MKIRITAFLKIITLAYFATGCINPGGITGADMNPGNTPNGTTTGPQFIQDLFFQEFWSDGKLFYLTSNRDTKPAFVTFFQNGSAIADAGLMAGANLKTISISTIATTGNIDIFKNGTLAGSLVLPAIPRFASSAIFQIANSINSNESNLPYWQIEAPVSAFKENNNYTITLKIEKAFTVFSLRKIGTTLNLDHYFKKVQILNATSSDLDITQNSTGMLFQKKPSTQPEPDFYSVTLAIKIPPTDDHRNTLMYLNGQGCNADGCSINNLTAALPVVAE